MNAHFPSVHEPLPSLTDVRDRMLASIRLQHPEWSRSAGAESVLAQYDRKLSMLLGSVGNDESLSDGLPA